MNDYSLIASPFVQGLQDTSQPSYRTEPASTTPSQPSATQNPSNVTYYIPNYKGTGPMYVWTGQAMWQWMRPDEYQRRLAAGEIPVATQGEDAFNQISTATYTREAQERSTAAEGNLADIQNTALPMERRLRALSGYTTNVATAGDARQRLQQMYQALQAAPEDVRNAFIAQRESDVWEGSPRWWRGEFTVNWDRSSMPTAPAAEPALPPLDIYNPGAFLAALARRTPRLPLPRANQITPLFIRRATPTQLSLLGTLASNYGIPPEDYIAEIERFQPSGLISPRVQYRF